MAPTAIRITSPSPSSTTAAIVCAADPVTISGSIRSASRVEALLHRLERTKWDGYQAALKKLTVDGGRRGAPGGPWPDWAVTTVIDTSAVWPSGVAGGVLPQDAR